MRLALIFSLLIACNGGDDDLYETCDQADDCTVPDEADAVCIEKSGDGFCSWTCDADADCSWDDEDEDAIDEDFTRVCASFESEENTYCFPSCEDDDGGEEACPDGMNCRSTGGGDENRKVCFPTDGSTTD